MIQANRSHQKQIAHEKEETTEKEKDVSESIQIVEVHVEESQEIAQDQEEIKEEEIKEDEVKRDVEVVEEVDIGEITV